MNTYEDVFDSALREKPVHLSFEGMARRHSMGQALETAVVSRRRRRRAAQGSVVLAMAAAVLWILLPVTSAGPDLLSPSAKSYENMALMIVRDQPGIVQRFAYRSSVVFDEVWVDDDRLIDLLSAAGQPSGVLRIEGRFMLTDPIVTEEPPD